MCCSHKTQVYNESVRDLLGSDGSEEAVDLEIRVGKGARGGPSVYVEGLVECDVSNMREVEHLMRQGSRNRATASNNVNEHSSRSHLVLTLKVVATRRDTGTTAHGKLNLIDLAGTFSTAAARFNYNTHHYVLTRTSLQQALKG